MPSKLAVGAVAALAVLLAAIPATQLLAHPAGPPVAVELERLLGAYRADSSKADAEFNGRTIETAGLVSDVYSGPYARTALVLGDSSPMLVCFPITSQEKFAEALGAGATVRLRGVVSGFAANVLVDECALR